MDNSPHNTPGQGASLESPSSPSGWRSTGRAVWSFVHPTTRRRLRALQITLIGLILVCVIGLLVLNAASHYARGVRALKAHEYAAAASDFSAARVLFFPYRDAQVLQAVAQQGANDAAAAPSLKQAEAPLMAQLARADAQLKEGDAGGVLATLQTIDAVDLQTAIAGSGTVSAAADALARELTAASRTALSARAWLRAGRLAAAVLVIDPSSQPADTLQARAQTGQQLSAELDKAKRAARHHRWQAALNLATAVIAAQKDFPGAAAVVAQARAALAPKPKPTSAATAAPAPQTGGRSGGGAAAQPPPP